MNTAEYYGRRLRRRVNKGMTNTEKISLRLARLNKRMGSPSQPYADERRSDGQLIPNAGHFMLDGNSCGYRIERMEASGGTSSPFGQERMTMRAIVDHLGTILDAIELISPEYPKRELETIRQEAL